ncbi:hypothetical protein [Lewinella sp. IMCC34183]|uniref:hypothetical protein n=1 Tax=Lewinella sp. IMCC34183 TaxID=2248762 RepID=UPI000E2577A2|nr:hypothetical protein [Lewinella sp. IMCC34183]
MLLRILLVLALLAPSLSCYAQQGSWTAHLVYGRAIGASANLEHTASYGLLLERTVASTGRWSFAAGAGLSRMTTDVIDTEGPGILKIVDGVMPRGNVRFAADPLLAGLSLSAGYRLGDFRLRAALLPAYVVAGGVAVSAEQEHAEYFAREYSADFDRRFTLGARTGISRRITGPWSAGVMLDVAVVAPRVSFTYDYVICPLLPPCFTRTDADYDTAALRRPVLSVLLSRAF